MIYFATRHDIDGAPFYYVRQQLDRRRRSGSWWRSSSRCSTTSSTAASSGSCTRSPCSSSSRCCRSARTSTARRRWIDLGVTRFQPSAAAVLLLALSIGAFLSDRMELLGSKRITLIVLALAAVPGVLRLPGAGLRLGHGHRGAGARRCCSSTARRGRTSPSSAATGITAFVVALKVLPHGRHPPHPAVPGRPALRLPQPRSRTRRAPGTTSSSR